MAPPRNRNVSNNAQASPSASTNASPSSTKKSTGRPSSPSPESVAVHCDWVVDPPLLPQISTSNVPSPASGVLSPALIGGSSDQTSDTNSQSLPSSGQSQALLQQQQQSPVVAIGSPQQQQQQVTDVLARCQHLTMHYGGDKLYMWGGWLGAGTDHPAPDALCCYDLTVSPAQQQQQHQQNLASSSGGATAASVGPLPIAPSPSHPGWVSTLVRIAGSDFAHPASSQFAWAEIAPGTALLFGGWTGASRTNAVTMLSLPEMRWKTVETSGDRPPPLTFATAVCASGGKKFVVYGGNGVDGPVADVYLLDLTTLVWRLLPSAGAPAKRSSHTATLIRDNLMVVFGGRSVPDLASLSLNSALTGLSNTVSGLGGATPSGGLLSSGADRSNAQLSAQEKAVQAALQAQQQAQQLLYAGTPLLMNDIAVFDVAAAHWQIGLRLEGTAPAARFGHTAVAATPNHVVFFGGTNDQGTLMNDAWVLAFDRPGTILWRPVAHSPVPPPLSAKSGDGSQTQRTATPPTSATSSGASGGGAGSGASLVAPPPAPRTSTSILRLGKSSCIALVGGRTQAVSLLPLKPGQPRFPCSASVHFLDVTRLSVAEETAEKGPTPEGDRRTP